MFIFPFPVPLFLPDFSLFFVCDFLFLSLHLPSLVSLLDYWPPFKTFLFLCSSTILSLPLHSEALSLLQLETFKCCS